ncbi:MAG: hypothetical protein KBD53_06090 [Candidatus Omnitrophica bacterium]|nr:hypothetical protein [Candidatus Omnitrophota bacterium]
MKILSRCASFLSKPLPILMMISWGLWILLFQKFIFGELSLVGDATSYYDHVKFFIDSLSRGVYPLWDPEWCSGVPNEFFLRRMGSFNPFLLIILAFYKIGLPFINAYFIFLVFYWFLGTLGFFCLAQRLFVDVRISFTAFLLLLFSSLGTRLFDSFIILEFVPMVWFFFFLVDFSVRPKRFSFIGMTFTFMLLLTTYIPFYFLTILFIFLLTFLFVCFKQMKIYIHRYLIFIKQHKILSAICIFLILFSLYPGYRVYIDGKNNELSLPVRNTHSAQDNILTVATQTLGGGGIVEPLEPSQFFQGLDEMQFERFYIPIFAFMLLMIGLSTKTTKTSLVILIWGLIIFLIGLNDATPLYQFLYQHIFYFKYFRNFLFFLWIILLPLFILLICEQFRQFLSYPTRNIHYRRWMISFLILSHLLLVGYLCKQDGALFSSFLSVVIGLILFISSVLSKPSKNHTLFLIGLLLTVAVQPVEVYSYFIKNSPIKRTSRLPYDYYSPKFTFEKDLPTTVNDYHPSIYYSTYWFNYLNGNLNINSLNKYLNSSLLIYDHVQTVSDDTTQLEKIGKSFSGSNQTAFIHEENVNHEINQPAPAEIVSEQTGQLKVLHYTANEIKIRTTFEKTKFLVYNDAYHSRWNAFINGQKTKIYRTNVAFKGLWVPAGENIILMRYESLFTHIINYGLLAVFYLTFAALIWFRIRDKHENLSEI